MAPQPQFDRTLGLLLLVSAGLFLLAVVALTVRGEDVRGSAGPAESRAIR